MSEKLTQDDLLQKLSDAKQQLSVGSLYRHYKGNDYKLIGLAILESNNDICVIYQAQYGEKLTFVRPVSVWNENLDMDGKQIKRFQLI